MMPGESIIGTIPTIFAVGVLGETSRAIMGKAGGSTHWHFRGKKPMSHRHEGGHITHEHKSLRGYGRTRRTLKRL